MTAPPLPQARPCPDCGSEVAATLLACPGCRALVHRDALERLATTARAAESRGDVHAALSAWREALALLPVDAGQRAPIESRLAALGRQADAMEDGAATAPKADEPARPMHLRLWAGIAALALFALGKGKLLLAGLTKLPTLLSMFTMFALYWSLFGWQWAAGVVLCIYVHEIGHVAALARYGVRTTTVMFVPFLGAFVAWKERLGDPRQEALVAVAGPVWGAGAGLVAWALARMVDVPVLGAIAATAGAFNLLNLLPIAPLDGSHVVKVLTRLQRLVLGLALVGAWRWLDAPFAGLLGVVLLGFALFTAPAREADHEAFAWFAITAAVLAWLSRSFATAVAAVN